MTVDADLQDSAVSLKDLQWRANSPRLKIVEIKSDLIDWMEIYVEL